MTDIVEEWEWYLSTSRISTNTNTPATISYAPDLMGVTGVAGVDGETPSSLLSALLFAYAIRVLFRSAVVSSCYSLLQSAVFALGFVMVSSRFIGYVVFGTYMVR